MRQAGPLRHLALALLVLLGAAGTAMAGSSAEMEPQAAAQLLSRAAEATREQSYTGTFIYREGVMRQVFRIAHLRDGDYELEKLETVDGPMREIIRTPTGVYIILPDVHRVVRTTRGDFGAGKPFNEELLGNLGANYQVQRTEVERVAGRDTVVLTLLPRDGYRYGRRFWSDTSTGLLLRAALLSGQEQLDHFQFIQINVGPITRDAVRPSMELPQDAPPAGPTVADTGWSVRSLPSGFRKTREMLLPAPPGTMRPVQITFSDGLAAVSVFIEPMGGRHPAPGLARRAGRMLYVRLLEDYIITVVGDVPPATVVDIGNAVARRTP